MAKRCGYCRMYNHTAPKCPTKLNMLNTAQRHVGRQRKDLAEILVKNGYGIGALLKVFSYQANDWVPCMVTQESLDSVVTNTFIEWNTIKYSKRVSMRLMNYSGNSVVPDGVEFNDMFVMSHHTFYITVTPMQTGITDLHANLFIGELPNGPNANRNVTNKSAWDYYAELLAPSDEGYVSEEAMQRKFAVHDRLGGDVRWHSPIIL